MTALVTLAEVPAQAWKNGGGLTRELLLLRVKFRSLLPEPLQGKHSKSGNKISIVTFLT
jgi:hypothetical protein